MPQRRLHRDRNSTFTWANAEAGNLPGARFGVADFGLVECLALLIVLSLPSISLGQTSKDEIISCLASRQGNQNGQDPITSEERSLVGNGAFPHLQALLALTGAHSSWQDASDKGNPKTLPDGSAVIENFEEGFASWRLVGDSFSKGVPFDGTTYNARASAPQKFNGFEGNKFAFSFNRSNADTGVATSREITVNWPQISFLINGGNDSQKLTFNLIVDGTVVRTASGSGSMNFVKKAWDVAEFKGRTATFEIRDSSTVANLGFVGVDNIRGERMVTEVVGDQHAGTAFNPAGAALPSAVSRELYAFFSKSKIDRQDQSAVMGVGVGELNRIKTAINLRVVKPDLDFIQFESETALSNRLSLAADQVILNLSLKPNRDLVSYIHGSMILNWARTHILFDAREDSVRRQTRTSVLNMRVPATVCGFSSWFCAVIASHNKKTSIVKIEGRLRGQGGAGKPDHSWNALVLSNGQYLFADVQHSRISLVQARNANGNFNSPLVLATDFENRVVFSVNRFQMTEVSVSLSKDSLNASARIVNLDRDRATQLGIEDWAKLPAENLNKWVAQTWPSYHDGATWRG